MHVVFKFLSKSLPGRYDMKVRSQMQGGKNRILPKVTANRFFRESHWLEIWKNHFCPSMGPNGGSVAMDSVERGGDGPQGDDSSPPPLCGLIFFEGDRCLCLTLKFVERLKCYSA